MVDFENYITMHTSYHIDTPYNVSPHNDNKVLLVIKLHLIESKDASFDVYI